MSPSWFTQCHFHQGAGLSNCVQNTRFRVRSQHGKCDDVLQREALVATGVFHTLRYIYKKARRWFLTSYNSPLWFTLSHYYQDWLSYCIQNTDYWYTLNNGNEMMCRKERHPLLLKYFIIILASIWKMGGASNMIHEPLTYGHTVQLLLRLTLNLHRKCWQIWGK